MQQVPRHRRDGERLAPLVYLQAAPPLPLCVYKEAHSLTLAWAICKEATASPFIDYHKEARPSFPRSLLPSPPQSRTHVRLKIKGVFSTMGARADAMTALLQICKGVHKDFVDQFKCASPPPCPYCFKKK